MSIYIYILELLLLLRFAVCSDKWISVKIWNLLTALIKSEFPHLLHYISNRTFTRDTASSKYCSFSSSSVAEKKKLTADSVIFKESESLLPQYSENTHTHTHFSEVLMQRNDSVTFQFVWKLRLGWRVRYSLQTEAGWSRPPPPPPPPPPWEIEMGVFCRHKQPAFLAPVQVGVRGQRRGRGRGREGKGVKQDGWERMINVRRAGRGLGRL